MGKPGPAPEALYIAQHKAIFARIARDINRHYPDTVVLEKEQVIRVDGKLFPAFIRLAKGSLSMHSYMVNCKEELKEILPKLFHIKRPLLVWSRSFYEQFAQASDPPIECFLLQPFLNFRQYTVDAYVFRGRMRILGITESIYTLDRRSFQRFDFPGDLPPSAMHELHAMLVRLVERLQFDNAGFDVEFFLTPDNHIILIEFNTRLSLQFVPLIYQWYEISALEVMSLICIVIEPQLIPRSLQLLASSCVLRSFEDKKVVRVPTRQEIIALKKSGHIEFMRVLVDPGYKLSDHEQDSYSYRYALVDVLGHTRQEIFGKLEFVKHQLHFELII